MLIGNWEYITGLLFFSAGPLECNKTKLLWDFPIAGNPSGYKFFDEDFWRDCWRNSGWEIKKIQCPCALRCCCMLSWPASAAGHSRISSQIMPNMLLPADNYVSWSQDQGLNLHKQQKEQMGKCRVQATCPTHLGTLNLPPYPLTPQVPVHPFFDFKYMMLTEDIYVNCAQHASELG